MNHYEPQQNGVGALTSPNPYHFSVEVKRSRASYEAGVNRARNS